MSACCGWRHCQCRGRPDAVVSFDSSTALKFDAVRLAGDVGQQARGLRCLQLEAPRPGTAAAPAACLCCAAAMCERQGG